MQITVAICTWNRCALLRQALEQMTKLSIPPDVQWELLVVDNNSTDATPDVANSFESRLPIRRIFEPKAGKSYALNRAISEASGDYILWTDDDALVDKLWLSAYYTAFKRWPDAAIFGGPVEPAFDGVPPPWLLQALSKVTHAYAGLDLGIEPFSLTQDAALFGVNMAVRKAEQERHLYDTKLGPRPNSSLRGEDIALVRALLEDGVEGRWVPAARVRHVISKERQTVRYLRAFYYGVGQSYAMQTDDDQSWVKLFGKPRWLWRRALEAELGYWFHRLLNRPEAWADDLRKASEAWGQMSWYDLRRQRSRDSL